MATARPYAPALLKGFFPQPSPCVRFLPLQQVRTAVQSANAAKYKRKDVGATKKKKQGNTSFVNHDLKDAVQFALCDAMRYIRAFEVGREPTSSKYEMAIKLRTLKNGPVVRNRFRLPHPVNTDVRIAVICPPNSKPARAAKSAGAVLIGEETVFEAVKDGRIEFDRCICHVDSLQKLNKAGIARILGPRGLMPSAKVGTVVKDVDSAVKDMVGGSEYRERMGVIRMAVGQLGFSPEEMQRNIKAFMDNIKRDCALISDKIAKEVHEVVLSSTNSPGFSLNGDFKSATSVPAAELSTL